MTQTESAPRRRFLATIFLSPTERRLRAGWRLALQALMQIVFTLAAGCALLLAPGGLFAAASSGGDALSLGIAELTQIATTTLSVFLARRLLDKRSFVSLGLELDRHTWLDLAAGIGITFVMMGSIFVAEWSLGWLTLNGFAWATDAPKDIVINVLIFLVIFIFVGWNEELMSRGYHLQTIVSGLTLFWGLVISSAIFGVLHLGNPNATWIGAAGIFFAGMFLGYAFVRTGRLWLSIGLHVGWNFFEGVIFGFPVSGLSLFHLTRIAVAGPKLWTGGDFGPEAGLVMLPAIALGMTLIYLYTRQNKKA
jgi:membrane protease YdiL (CAAX protease family)